MTERSYQDAVQMLKSRMGGRWQGFASEGRDEMARILKEELGYDSGQASDAIDAMVATGSIRYVKAGPDNVEVAAAPPIPAGSGSGAANTPGPGASGMPGTTSMGYWQIGDGDVEPPGRKGQIQPT